MAVANELDFKGLAQELLSRSLDFVSAWLPGGKARGREYVCGSLRGEQGDSFSVNLSTGAWADFADANCKGGDLISLFAAIEGLTQGEAYRRLVSEQGFELSERPALPPPPPQLPPEPEVCMPPDNAVECDFIHPVFGEAIAHWTYRTPEGAVIFHVARYEKEGRKQILPWSWSDEKGWINKGWPAPRSLYGLELLAERPEDLVLIVEGEKACDAARELLGHKYVCITWPNGSQAFRKADWEPVFGTRGILIAPDADTPGIEARDGIAKILKGHCDHIKILTPEGMSDGWDLADALKDDWTTDQVIEWARSCVSVYWTSHQTEATVVPEPEPAQEVAVIPPTKVHKDDPEEAPEEAVQSSMYWAEKLGLPTTKAGLVIVNVNCAIRAITNYPLWKDFIWFDEFHGKIFTTWNLKQGETFREWDDVDTIYLQSFMQENFAILKITKDTLYDALTAVAKLRTRNEPKEYFESLTWDGEPRIDKFLVDCFLADDGKYCQAVSRNWWISLVARVYIPGCKVDTMLILEGGQGKFKSTAMEIVGGPWYAEAHGQVSDTNFYYNIQGKLITEFAELSGISKAEATAIKSFISKRFDRYRAVWARSSRDFPRQGIFVATTNEEEYLKDNTGARRFWPIKIHQIDLERIKNERDQLFAEAIHCYKSGEKWWEMPAVEAQEEQEKRRLSDEWEYVIAQHIIYKTETTIMEVAVEALKIEPSKVDILIQRRIAKVLRLLSWDKFFLSDGLGQQRKIWRNGKYYSEPDF